MSSDHRDQVVVAGRGEESRDAPTIPVSRRRRSLGMAFVALAVTLAVAWIGREPPADTFSPELPEVPAPTAPDPGTSAPRTAGGLAGFRRLDLPGDGRVVAVGGDHRSWAALVASPAPAVWVSSGGARWRYRPLPEGASIGHEAWVEWVGEDLIVVTEGGGGAPPVRAWASADHGESWRQLRFRDAFAALVSGTVAMPDTLLVFGSDAGAPAIWRLADDILVPMSFEAGTDTDGRVTAVIDGPVAFGHDAAGPAVWRLRSEGWRRVPVSTPFDRPEWRFADVAALPAAGALGVIAPLGFTTGHMVRSSDLVAWEVDGEAGMVTAGAVVSGPDATAVVGDPAQGAAMVALTDGETWDVVVGRSPDLAEGSFTGAALGSDLVVVAGSHRGAPALWIRGPIPVPRWELPPESARGGTWERIASVEGRHLDSVSVVQREEEAFYAAHGRVWWIPDLDDPGYVIPAGISGDRRVIGVNGEIFVLGPTSRDGIMVVAHRIGESWHPSILWDGWVAGITVVDGQWLAFGESTEGLPVVGRSPDLDDWRVATLPPADVRPAFHPLAFAGGMLRKSSDGYRFSPDGSHWTAADGEPLGLRGGVAALDLGRVGPGTTRIRILEDGIEGREIDLPLDPVRYVNRAFGSVLAIGEGEVVVERGNGGWDRIPLDLLHGVEGSVRDAVLAPDGTVIAFEVWANRLRILRWREH